MADTQGWREAWRQRGPRVVFTPAGYLVLALAFVLILDTFNDPTLIKRLASSFTLAVAFVDCLVLIRQRQHLRVTRVWAPRVPAGEPVQVGAHLTSTSTRDALVSLKLDAPRQPLAWQWVLHQQEAEVFPIRSGQTLARGVYAFPALTWALHSALRLCQVRQALPRPADAPTELLVWPAPWPEPLPPLPLAEADMGALPGLMSGQPDPREGQLALNTPGVHGWLRAWRQGDRLAHLAHKASAHRDQWLVQTASSQPQEAPRDVMLTLPWAMAHTDDLERALSLLGAMVTHVLGLGRRVGLTLGTTTWTPDRGAAHRVTLLDALARHRHGDAP
jgi:hypothetical protein